MQIRIWVAGESGEIPADSRFFLSEELALLGMDLSQSPAAVEVSAAALRRAMQESDVTLLLFEDSTAERVAQAAADCFGVPLQRYSSDEKETSDTAASAETDGSRFPSVPQGSTAFQNLHGRHPGFALSRYGRILCVLPLYAGELMPLFFNAAGPFLASLTGQPYVSHTVGVFGLTEASVRRRLAEQITRPDPLVTLYTHDGECLVRVIARTGTAEEAAARCETAVQAICDRLGAAVYGVDAGGLAAVTVALLEKDGLKIATAESCTAGLLSGALTQVPGASSVFECGVAAYSNEIKQSVLGVPAETIETFGAVSSQTAAAMALGARRLGSADLGIGITGVAGPQPSEGKPVGTVFLALADSKRTWVKQITGYESLDREAIRHLAAASALDLTRRYLEALPTVMAGGELWQTPAPATPVIPAAEPVGELPRGRRRRRRRALLTLLPVPVLCAAVAAYLLFWTPLTNRWDLDRLQSLYTTDSDTVTSVTTPEGYPEGMLRQFYALYSENEDVRGWLRIEGTGVNYPVMDATKTDYSAVNFARARSVYGLPYFSEHNAFVNARSVNRNLTVTGNNAPGHQMFAPLTDYFRADTLIRCQTVSLDTLYRSGSYTVFAVAVTTGDTADPHYFDYTRNAFDDDEAFAAFADELRARAILTTPLTVLSTDTLLLLCTDVSEALGIPDARLLVCARTAHTGDSEQTTVTRQREVTVPASWLPYVKDGDTASLLGRHTFVATKTMATDNAVENPAADPDYLPESEPLDTPQPDAVPADATTAASGGTTGRGGLSTASASSDTAPVTGSKTTEAGSENPGPTTTKTTKATKATTKATTKIEKTTGKATSSSKTTTTAFTPKPAGQLKAAVRPESDYLSSFGVKNRKTGETLTGATREQVQRAIFYVVKKELGSARAMQRSTEAQKAQAVASYTYVLKYSRVKGKPYEVSETLYNPEDATERKLYEAVGEVLGVKLLDLSQNTVDKQLCETMYFSSSAGVTATNSQVYTASLPYLQSVKSPYDTAATIQKYFPNYQFTATLTVTFRELCEKLESSENLNAGAIKGDTKNGVPLYAVSYDGGPNGYVAQTNLYYTDSKGRKQSISGYDIRKAIGSGRMQSHAFTVKAYDKATDTLTLETRGWGHGVGLSQTGAVGYANEAGWTYDQILRHYYSVTASSAHQLVAPAWD